ncbi:hypothetical protein VFPFJ_03438 [Purpureocillium lilacinum]|uniref:Uncharacterized protein n=1 Tax=Purpureocillium lilacinum TaxID=33203 RepID=A0A179HPU6_PURLI|nr:hypothetical protein VFPFJ_03438 [Purpureocillium lilacinum]OAQ91698.1 hypothetical protein VFPFJ_03438 [Purpureocillium lilacinum]
MAWSGVGRSHRSRTSHTLRIAHGKRKEGKRRTQGSRQETTGVRPSVHHLDARPSPTTTATPTTRRSCHAHLAHPS